jgi:hypothetical protein
MGDMFDLPGDGLNVFTNDKVKDLVMSEMKAKYGSAVEVYADQGSTAAKVNHFVKLSYVSTPAHVPSAPPLTSPPAHHGDPK